MRFHLCLAFPALASVALAAPDHDHSQTPTEEPNLDLPAWLRPSLFVRGLYQEGAEQGSSPGIPEDGFSAQLIEPGLVLDFDDYRFNSILHVEGSSEGWEAELEELSLLTPWLPWGGELTLGQQRVPWGLHNEAHLHGWALVDQNLLHGRVLGDESLLMRGGEFSWTRETLGIGDSFRIGLGESVTHSHGHDHDEDEGGGHAGETEAGWDGLVVSGRVGRSWRPGNRTEWSLGLSALAGEKENGEWGQLFGLDAGWQREFTSIERLSLNVEAGLHRFRGGHHEEHHGHHEEDHDHHDDDHGHHEEDHGHHEEDHGHHEEHDDHAAHGHGGSEDWYLEPGISAVALARLDQHFDLAVRAGWIGGVTEAERPERWRLSPALTWYPDEHRRTQVRIQYAWEHGSNFDEHRLSLQLGWNWGEH